VSAQRLVSADELLTRLWAEVRDDACLAPLVALAPRDRPLGVMDGITLLPAVMAHLRTQEDLARTLDALAHAYARAAGLQLTEVPSP
jgi:hypothetical protein